MKFIVPPIAGFLDKQGAPSVCSGGAPSSSQLQSGAACPAAALEGDYGNVSPPACTNMASNCGADLGCLHNSCPHDVGCGVAGCVAEATYEGACGEAINGLSACFADAGFTSNCALDFCVINIDPSIGLPDWHDLVQFCVGNVF